MILLSRFRIGALCFVPLLVAGCDSLEPELAAGDAEHHFPEHRPQNFTDGVRAVRSRLAKLSAEGAAQNRQQFARQGQELRDIIQWLPELAAETDLRKADWDRVHAASRRLAGRWGNFSARLAGNSSANAVPVTSEMEGDLAELDRLAQIVDSEGP